MFEYFYLPVTTASEGPTTCVGTLEPSPAAKGSLNVALEPKFDPATGTGPAPPSPFPAATAKISMWPNYT